MKVLPSPSFGSFVEGIHQRCSVHDAFGVGVKCLLRQQFFHPEGATKPLELGVASHRQHKLPVRAFKKVPVRRNVGVR